MSDQTKGGIAWTNKTWNPVRGCSRVSRGCEHCYAETVARRFAGPGHPYEGLVRLDRDGKAKAQWNGVVRLVPEHLFDPLRWTKPRKVFANSMSDLFHEALPFETIAAIFGVMAASPAHTFQVLTKRPERAREFFAWLVEQDTPSAEPTTLGLTHAIWCALRAEALHHPEGDSGPLHRKHCADPDGPWPLPNVWLGVSVEDQGTADERIPHLLECPAAVRFVSYEPALGPVDFAGASGGSDWLGDPYDDAAGERGIDWIIVGGESGPGARPFDLAWARSVIAQCREAGVACFVKQLGTDPRGDGRDVRPMRTDTAGVPAPSGSRECRLRLRDRKGGDMSEWPEDLRVREWPEVVR